MVVHHANVQHACSTVVLDIQGYDILRTFAFYAWSCIPNRYFVCMFAKHPLPLQGWTHMFHSRGMDFPFEPLDYGLPSFWTSICGTQSIVLYEINGLIMHVFVPAIWLSIYFSIEINFVLMFLCTFNVHESMFITIGSYPSYMTSSIEFDSNVPIDKIKSHNSI